MSRPVPPILPGTFFAKGAEGCVTWDSSKNGGHVACDTRRKLFLIALFYQTGIVRGSPWGYEWSFTVVPARRRSARVLRPVPER